MTGGGGVGAKLRQNCLINALRLVLFSLREIEVSVWLSPLRGPTVHPPFFSVLTPPCSFLSCGGNGGGGGYRAVRWNYFLEGMRGKKGAFYRKGKKSPHPLVGTQGGKVPLYKKIFLRRSKIVTFLHSQYNHKKVIFYSDGRFFTFFRYCLY